MILWATFSGTLLWMVNCKPLKEQEPFLFYSPVYIQPQHNIWYLKFNLIKELKELKVVMVSNSISPLYKQL